jgi:hypothetical protein
MSNNNTSNGSPGSGASTGSAGSSASSGGTNAGSGSVESMSGLAGSSTGMPAESGSPVSLENDASSSGVTATTTDAAAADAQDSSGATVTTSCAGTSHPLCIDFEDGKVDPPWTLPASDAAVETGNAAHGRYALHLSNLHSHPTLYLQTPQMPGIKDQLWGRFYLYMDPAAPVGHGDIVRANDVNTNWYEVGFEANGGDPNRATDHSPTTGCYLADWHTGVSGLPEKGQSSTDVVPHAAWTCVEFYFDGATPAVARIWGDGVEVQLNPPPATPAVQKAIQFVSFGIGITLYHGGSTVTYEGDMAPYLTDEWIDDVALDTTRIGCL